MTRTAKPKLAMATIPAAPFAMTKDEATFFAVEVVTRRMIEADWLDDVDIGPLQATYGLTFLQAQSCVREARRNTRRALCRPQAAHQLVTSTLASVIEQSMNAGDLRGAADAAYKLSQASGTQASIKLKVLEQQQRMDHLKSRLLTGQSSVEEIAATIIEDLMSTDSK